MEIHDYLDHGYRVLSSREGGLPEVIAHATDVAGSLPGLNTTQIADMKLAGNQDGELYRLLLVAQCNALSKAMPFLFEHIDDESELLLPDNLIRTDSLIRSLVDEIPEADWADIEIIGWLYQFYISEKKDQVIGKVVKSEDIPAATQLFTPSWIVKYMVQNSLGAQWLATYPESTLKEQMEYYIEPAEQADEVKVQLAAATPSTLDPERLTFIDPASGSGHILVEAYELFKAIYLERGYRQRDVPQLILEKNLFGLDIDERAAQLTGFALMMKGRADDRQLFERGLKLNVMALVNSAGFDAEGMEKGVELAHYGLTTSDLKELKQLFEHATTFGSLIQLPEGMTKKLPLLKQLSEAISQDLFVSEALNRLRPLVQQAELLAAQYDAVVANPPYMGSNYHPPTLKKFLNDFHKRYERDLFAAFVVRNQALTKPQGRSGFMTPMVWMFISSHEYLRLNILRAHTLSSLVHLEYNASGAVRVPLCTFVIAKNHFAGFTGSYIRLTEFGGEQRQGPKMLEAIRNPECGWLHRAKPDDFEKIPGSPVAYWISEKFRDVFSSNPRMSSIGEACQGLSTADNARFVRTWQETSLSNTGFNIKSRADAKASGMKWFPLNKGGEFRKWYGNHQHVVDWEDDGRALFSFRPRAVVRNPDSYFESCVSWSDVTSSANAFRYYPPGFVQGDVGHSVYGLSKEYQRQILSLCNNKFYTEIISILNPTLHFHVGYYNVLPFASGSLKDMGVAIGNLIEQTRLDWNAYERSWDFSTFPILTGTSVHRTNLESSYTAWITQNREIIAAMKRLEEENNSLFINAYGLADKLTPYVPIEQITLTVNPAYRYGGKLTEEELWTRFRLDTMAELVSYAIGCMMGRYSLDEPGLIYAHAGNIGFDATRYKTFPADADGIVPINDTLWFEDDATNRVREFLNTVWGAETLEENMDWLAESLGKKGTETPEETIRRYLSGSFYKDHLQTYKKRPIYWHFSSGKQGAFQALVYLHRYQEGTLARMRAEYVVPLTGKMQSRIEMLEKDRNAASATAVRTKIAKQIELLKKKHVELLAYDEKLRHYADMRIQLDLDDGVKMNYGKFGDLLAEVKAVTGGAGED